MRRDVCCDRRAMDFHTPLAHRYEPWLSMILALTSSFLLAQGCSDDDADEGELDEVLVPENVERGCEAYCLAFAACNEERSPIVCERNCRVSLSTCNEFEWDDVAAELEACAMESCDDFDACAADVSPDCFFQF